jgi:hypothetical protein
MALTQVQGGMTSIPVLATAQNTTSGTAVDFTSSPSWVKRITVMFNGVSLNGSAGLVMQVGAGSIVATGYSSGVSSGASVNSSTTYFYVMNNAGAAVLSNGQITLANMGSNNWSQSGIMGFPTNALSLSCGYISLSGALDRVRITTTNGTDTFDAGSINIMYEG